MAGHNPPLPKMERKPPVDFTVERKLQYLELLKVHGMKWRCAEMVGVTYATVKQHRKSDPAFAEQFEEAAQCWIDEVLLKAAVERAVTGVTKPIIGGKDRDEVVTYVQEYSDSLMALLLKGQRQEEYGALAGKTGSSDGKSTGVMFIPSAAPVTNGDWESKFGEAAKGQGNRSE